MSPTSSSLLRRFWSSIPHLWSKIAVRYSFKISFILRFCCLAWLAFLVSYYHTWGMNYVVDSLYSLSVPKREVPQRISKSLKIILTISRVSDVQIWVQIFHHMIHIVPEPNNSFFFIFVHKIQSHDNIISLVIKPCILF